MTSKILIQEQKPALFNLPSVRRLRSQHGRRTTKRTMRAKCGTTFNSGRNSATGMQLYHAELNRGQISTRQHTLVIRLAICPATGQLHWFGLPTAADSLTPAA